MLAQGYSIIAAVQGTSGTGSHADDSAQPASEEDSRVNIPERPSSSSSSSPPPSFQAADMNKWQASSNGAGLPSEVKADRQIGNNGISLPSIANEKPSGQAGKGLSKTVSAKPAGGSSATTAPSSSSPSAKATSTIHPSFSLEASSSASSSSRAPSSRSSHKPAEASSPVPSPSSSTRAPSNGPAGAAPVASSARSSSEKAMPSNPVTRQSDSAAQTSSSSRPADTAGSQSATASRSSSSSSSAPNGAYADAASSSSSPAVKGSASSSTARGATSDSLTGSSPKVSKNVKASDAEAGKATERTVMTHAPRKPAIWAAATPTGQALNSPTPPLKPKDPQPTPTAPFQSSSETKADSQGTSQPMSGKAEQSAPAMEYVARPKIDATGKPTGAVEVVPAGMTPTGSSPVAAMTSQSSSETRADAQGTSRAVPGKVEQSAPAMEYVTRPKIDATGKFTGAVEVVPAGTTSTGSSPRAAVTGNVVAASEAISRAAEKAREAPGKPETLPNQAGASASKPGAGLEDAGAAPNKAGAGAGSGDDQCRKQSKLGRSTTWKTRQASFAVTVIAWCLLCSNTSLELMLISRIRCGPHSLLYCKVCKRRKVCNRLKVCNTDVY